MLNNAYALILFACALTTFFLSPLTWHRKQVPGAKWFALMLLAVGLWCLTYAFEILAVSSNSKLFWLRIEYIGIVTLSPLWLMFTLTYTQRDNWSSKWYRYIIWIIPFITYLSVITNEYHHIHYSDVTYSIETPGHQLIITHGPGFYIFTAYSYILLLIGTIALIWAIINFPQVYRKQSAAIIIGALIPWIINLIYILNITSGYDPTPFAFSLTAIIYFWAIFRLDLLNVIPVARSMVIESMTDGMFVLDSQNLIVDINPAAARIIGIAHPSHAIGRPAGEILAPFPDYVNRYGNVFETREEFKLKSPHADGDYELEINPIRTQDGTIAGRIIIIRNITNRKVTEDALRKSEILYHTLIETLPIAIFQKNRNSRYTFVNQLYAENEGIPAEKILGKTDVELHPPELADLYQSTDVGILETGVPQEIEEEQELANGKRIPIHVVKTPLLDSSGEIIGVQGIYWDMTQIRLATREAQDRLDELTTVYAISQAVAQLEMDSLLNVVGQKIEQTFKVQSAFIALYDPENSIISIPYMINKGERITFPDLPYGKGFASEVIRTRQPLVINSDIEKRSRELGAAVLVASELGYPRSWMGVPMIVGDEVIGVMSTQDYDHENSFNDSDVKLFATIASNVGIAFKNAQLYQEVHEELTERKRAEADLADSQERLQAILDNAGAGIGVAKEDAKFIFVNDRWVEMFGYTPQELSKLAIWEISYLDEIPSIKEKFEDLASGRLERFQIEKKFKNKDGSTFWGTVSAKAIRQDDGSLENVIFIISDITLLKSTEAELIRANQLLVTQLEEIAILRDRLREQAIRDPLTNLYNRRFMEETLTLEIHRARRNQSMVSLVMMDIDHFKLVNDHFGHKTGDHLLESLGQMLLSNTRKSDVACRYGGEEFLIVLPGTSLEDAARRAEHFRANFEAIRVSGNNAIANATMSIGVACFPDHGEDGEQVLDRADEALYKAKAAGRNCVVMYRPEKTSDISPN
jgi:diguanylate cyclase (GGDEF)-like protein/PAS domain S-box-containing protein